MKKILLSSIMTVVVSTVGYLGMTANKTESEVALDANVEALATGEGQEPEWWDFFNNYYVEERIPITTTTCKDGKVEYRGLKISVSSCTQYTYAIYWHCYDGGKKDLCTNSGVHGYI